MQINNNNKAVNLNVNTPAKQEEVAPSVTLAKKGGIQNKAGVTNKGISNLGMRQQKGVFGDIVDWAGDRVDDVEDAAKSLLNLGKTVIKDVTGFVNKILKDIKKLEKNLLNGITSPAKLLTKLVDYIGDKLKELGKSISETVRTALDNLIYQCLTPILTTQLMKQANISKKEAGQLAKKIEDDMKKHHHHLGLSLNSIMDATAESTDRVMSDYIKDKLPDEIKKHLPKNLSKEQKKQLANEIEKQVLAQAKKQHVSLFELQTTSVGDTTALEKLITDTGNHVVADMMLKQIRTDLLTSLKGKVPLGAEAGYADAIISNFKRHNYSKLAHMSESEINKAVERETIVVLFLNKPHKISTMAQRADQQAA